MSRINGPYDLPKRYDNTKILHSLNPKHNDIVLNKDLVYRIVGVVMEKKKRYK